MAKIFQTFVKKVKRVTQIVDSGDAVLTNKIRIDYREKVGGFLDRIRLAPRTFERAAFTTRDALVVIAKTFEKIAAKLSQFIGLRVFERTGPKDLASIAPRVFERFGGALTSQFLAPRVFEKTAPKVTVRVDATATVSNFYGSIDSPSIAPRVFELASGPQDTHSFTVTGNGYAESVVTQTGVTNPNNVLGNTTNTAATSSAAASGLAGTTSNTTNFDITLDLPDVDLSNLISTIDSVTVNFERAGAVAGVSVGGRGTINTFWGFGGTPTTAVASETWNRVTALAKGVASADITAQVANDFANVNLLRLRFQGSVTSGAGLGATSTASFFRAWVSFTGNGVAN